MRKIFSVLVSMFVVSAALASYDASIRVDAGSWQINQGGEFQITTLSGYAGLIGLPSDDGAVNTFQTFCVQRSENLSFGGTYDVNLNTVTIAGNTPLDDKTAFLYRGFRFGTLDATSYGALHAYLVDGSLTQAQRRAQADSLQHAIWGFMGQETLALNNPYVRLANAVVGTAAWPTGFIGNVRVMNLFNGPPNGGNNQDLLTLVPLPGAALLGIRMLSC